MRWPRMAVVLMMTVMGRIASLTIAVREPPSTRKAETLSRMMARHEGHHRQDPSSAAGHRGETLDLLIETRPDLAELLAPPEFDIGGETIPLRHTTEDLSELFAVWAPDWLLFNPGDLDLKPVTRQALAALVHWTTILCGTSQLS